jgi:Ca-activated chloride channel family protein
MRGFQFSGFDPEESGKSKFDQLLDLLMQLLTYTSGDVGEALQWLNQLDREYQLSNEEYGMGDFIDDLKDKGISRKTKTVRRSGSLQKPSRGSGRKALRRSSESLRKPERATTRPISRGRATK